MTEFDINIIKKEAKENYENSWLDTARLLKLKGRSIKWKKTKGKEHPIMKLSEKMRKIMISYGFDELVNPTIVDENEVKKQYGPESAVILDRVFYLAGLPRPDIGLSDDKIEKIKNIVPNFSKIKELQKILRKYKIGELEGDDFVEEMVHLLNIKPEDATQIIETIFPELKDLKPVPTTLTLRSHMTSIWFSALSSLQEKSVLPLKLFSIGPRFRREQKLDAHHLYESSGLSLVVMAKDITLEDGIELTKKILRDLGFKDIKFVTKKATSKYYAPRTENEVYVKHDKEWIEVGDIGFYSPVSLTNYNIKYPVFNAGFGTERIAMIKTKIDDIRKLTYPQFYKTVLFSDKEIAKMISFKESPKTNLGKKIVKKISSAILKYKDEIGPKKFLIYKDKKISVFISEPEENKKLLGPAGLNVVYVYDSNLIGLDPKNKKFEEIIKKGVKIRSYIESISNLFAAKVENKEFGKHTIRIADTLHSINLEIEPAAERFILSNNKRIDIRGPIFIDIEIEKV